MLKLLSLFFALGLSACAAGHCNREGRPEKADPTRQKVRVYKYDGSKQCDEKETGLTLQEMASELGSIKIYSMSKQSDGQIRVQVCGALTGRANVYEITLSDLPKAEALGFKKWSF